MSTSVIVWELTMKTMKRTDGMELKEAIVHARQVAEGCASGHRDCAYQHDKLADWLEELQSYRNMKDLGRFHILPFRIGTWVKRTADGSIGTVEEILFNSDGFTLCVSCAGSVFYAQPSEVVATNPKETENSLSRCT